ncbi:MAG: AI-2E family transporter [Firmicutes bacterium]|nr:AI-2E family transporter [Bacillota bacterium]
MLRKNNKYVSLGLTLLSVIAIGAILILILFNLGDFYQAIKSFFSLISSVLYGLVFAYLMNPIMKLVERNLTTWLSRGNMPERRVKSLSRGIGIVAALIIFLLSVYALFAAIVPQVVASLEELLSPESINSGYAKVTEWIDSVIRGTPVENWFNQNGESVVKKVQDWIAKEVDFATALSSAAEQVYGIAKGVFNAVVGVVVAVYMLISKDRFQAQAKKITVALFRQDHADRVMELARRTNAIFGGFIVGKIIDSVIMGIICYIGTLILGTPYAMLVSVIVGVTNIIPFFGPLIGLVFCCLLVLLQNPLQALYLAIFLLVLQQVDGNIIGPRILGERLGISDFWILVSITVFGGLFGFAGMLIGVPVFTLIYSLINDGVNRALKKKQQPLQTDLYYSILTVSDLSKYKKEYSDSTVVYSEDTFETEFDPDDDIEYDDADL